MKRIKKFMMILLVTVALITTMSINCYASELGHDEFEKTELETVSNPTSVITILVNYKIFVRRHLSFPEVGHSTMQELLPIQRQIRIDTEP